MKHVRKMTGVLKTGSLLTVVAFVWTVDEGHATVFESRICTPESSQPRMGSA